MLRIILCIALCMTLAIAYNKSYVIIFPNAIRPGLPLKLGVNILRASAPVNVTCTMAKNNVFLTSQSGNFEAGEPGTLLLQVPTNATPGTYKIRVNGTGGLTFNNESQVTFKTKTMSILIQTDKPIYKQGQTVEPKFDVAMNIPSYVSSTDTIISGSVVAKYSDGKGVDCFGNAELPLTDNSQIKRLDFNVSYEGELSLCEEVKQSFFISESSQHFIIRSPCNPTNSKNTPVDGKGDFEFFVGSMGQFGEVEKKYQTVQVKASVKETLTDLSQVVWSEFTFYSSPYKIEILGSTPKVFKPGLTYTGFVKLSLVDGTPIEGEDQKLQIEARVTYALEIPEALKKLPPSYWEPLIEYKTVEEPVQELSVPNDGIVRFDLEVSQDLATEIAFTVIAGGNVVSTNKVSLNSNMTFKVAITPDMAPKSKMAAYYVRSDGEVVADVLNFNVKGAFKNQVSIKFDDTRAEVGQKVSMSLSADPGSFVGILAIDQSLLPFKYLHDDFTEEKVLRELDSYDTKRETNIARKKRSILQNIIPLGGIDVYDMFQNFGVIAFTDTMIYSHKNTAAWEAESNNDVGSLADIEPMQSYFKETWLWTSVTLGATGTTSLNVILPGGTSSWAVNAIAVHPETGLGVAKTELGAFRRFLVAVYMPDSVVLGEKLILRVAIWNVMGIDLDVDVILEKSDGFKSIVLGTDGKPTTVSEAQTQKDSVREAVPYISS
ncbi:CD109 antigen-like [Lingula anatina]|uniref:CD109 antigen-like n=1 Tax=Lingula anatina TaxID=7574 RepID=A0A1S3HD33_LINAN|nr:CD109 antigen-like [Lingula anatina]|eukprot:XP_013383952.1 CD109 antigen-like [Lingula anatina]